jgi:adenosylmethionine-8-amino-7-oxononanoate aminotransferase
VMTGFGRTGTMFAVEQAGVAPDLMCVGKGLTGGSLPLAATLASQGIFEAHKTPRRADMLFHSSSYTANPIACAAAVENLAIWREERTIERVGVISAIQSAACERAAQDARVRDVRRCGTIVAMDIAASAERGYLSGLALAFRHAALDRSVLLRPLGETVYVMPPYCATEAELRRVYDVIGDCIDEVVT